MALLESSLQSDFMVNWISAVIASIFGADDAVSYTHLRAHET